ncbi:MAG: hypothetical protein AB1715_01810 [Acidobacteriota bacterium]
MFFRIVTVISLLGLAGRLSYLRFRDGVIRGGAQAGSLTLTAYGRWLRRRLASLIKPAGWQAVRAAFGYCCAFYPAPFLRGAFVGLVSSFAYLALSGFAFALFSSRSLFGVPLVLHVICGGIFALSLAVFIVFQAKEHSSVFGIFTSGQQSLKFLLESFSRPLRRSLLFWIFGVAGLILISTSLFSMLPYFSYRAQLGLVETHRWSGLVGLLAAVAFLDAILPRRER